MSVVIPEIDICRAGNPHAQALRRRSARGKRRPPDEPAAAEDYNGQVIWRRITDAPGAREHDPTGWMQ
jgi:hypothetical protein